MAATTPLTAATGADFVFCCVGNDEDLRSVTVGPDGAFTGIKPGAIFIDHTTTSADVARELHAKAAEMEFSFVDAPVSGGQAGAENGQLTVMTGGDEEAVAKAAPLIDCFARMQARLGDSGWEPYRTLEQERRYRDWLARWAGDGLAVVDFGAGTAVPTVRMESERVAGAGRGLIRINPREPELPPSLCGAELSLGGIEACRELFTS